MKLDSDSFKLAATDLSNHLSCNHLTQFSVQVAQGELKKPIWDDPLLELLVKRGQEHETAYVEFLKKRGLAVVNLKKQSLSVTLEAMRCGSDVIVQATLSNEKWVGEVDILLKVPGKSRLGNWAYEVHDTKLALNTRTATVLQLCVYTDLLSEIQGSTPESMYVVKPGIDFPREPYRFAEFQAYYRQVKYNFEQTMAGQFGSTYPEPVEHCSICSWWKQCNDKRHNDDYLSLVAGIRTLQKEELKKQKIYTLEALAKVSNIQKPERGSKETLIKKQKQAIIQYQGRVQNELLHQMLDIQPGRGLNLLPEPNTGDIYFDLEGDAFYPDGGLEYLFGYAYKESGDLRYRKTWAIKRKEEKAAFRWFMEIVMENWERNPGMHIYHFAPYEPTKIKRLAMIHAIFENEVDKLLRGKRFIDLHLVFKESLLASVENYSLKELEKFTNFTRKIELPIASRARKSVEVALELNDFNSLDQLILKTLEDYNEDDCMATSALHVWLEGIREECNKFEVKFQRPELKSGEASENTQEKASESQVLFNALTNDLPEDKLTWNDEQSAKWLIANQIDYFNREFKASCWEYYRVRELEQEELLDERKAITGLQFLEILPKEGKERNQTHRYKFPPQEVSIDAGDGLEALTGEKIGTVKHISIDTCTIDIKKAATAFEFHPISIHVSDLISPRILSASMYSLASEIASFGLTRSSPFCASKDLLMKRKPQLIGGIEVESLLSSGNHVANAIQIALNLDNSVLAIQGPPGSGKTFTGANLIIELHKAGKMIGLTAVSHKVIRKLTEDTIKMCLKLNSKISFLHKISEKSNDNNDYIIEVKNSEQVRQSLLEGKVVCGTAWLWAEENSREILDYLIVDEAGQMSLSHVLAASRAAKNIILLGDPQQLEQPQKGSHPEGSDVAALTHLLDGHPTMPEGKGLFLDRTRRLHPDICLFTSELYYVGRLTSIPGLEKQVISGNTPFDGAGLFYVPVDHRGNQSKSPEEVKTIVECVELLLSKGKWTDKEGVPNDIEKKDILIVAPFNAQVNALREKLPGIAIGTVDKFQGQEAPVVIYSMTSSSPEDAPRGINFLYSPNRFNVATSRARCICILVASPKLFEPECNTIDQMRWANAMCRFKELSKKAQ